MECIKCGTTDGLILDGECENCFNGVHMGENPSLSANQFKKDTKILDTQYDPRMYGLT